MSIGFTVAIAAVPLLDLLDKEEIELGAVIVASETAKEADTAVEGSRRRLLAGVDAVVRSLPSSVRSDQGLSRAVGYALIGLADERMLHHPTGVIERWREKLLEVELYGSALAGQEIIRRARAAVHMGPSESRDGRESMESSSVLAPLYLGVLRAGFEGSLREDESALRSLISGLEEVVGARTPERVSARPIADERPGRLGVSLRGLMVAGLSAWLVVSGGAWYLATRDSLQASAAMADRIRAGLATDQGDGDIHGIGPAPRPVPGPETER